MSEERRCLACGSQRLLDRWSSGWVGYPQGKLRLSNYLRDPVVHGDLAIQGDGWDARIRIHCATLPASLRVWFSGGVPQAPYLAAALDERRRGFRRDERGVEVRAEPWIGRQLARHLELQQHRGDLRAQGSVVPLPSRSFMGTVEWD